MISLTKISQIHNLDRAYNLVYPCPPLGYYFMFIFMLSVGPSISNLKLYVTKMS